MYEKGMTFNRQVQGSFIIDLLNRSSSTPTVAGKGVLVPGLPNQNSRPSTRSLKRPLARCNCGSGNALQDRLPIVVPPRSNDLSGTAWKVYPN